MLSDNPLFAKISAGKAGFVPVYLMLLTHASFIVTDDVPVLLAVTKIVVGETVSNAMLVIWICSVFVNWKVSAPIHAATAMLTATVTAMRMIDATTGLRAFLLFNIFMLFLIPPFGVVCYVSGMRRFKSYDSRHHIPYA
jgi:hypothetical protein